MWILRVRFGTRARTLAGVTPVDTHTRWFNCHPYRGRCPSNKSDLRTNATLVGDIGVYKMCIYGWTTRYSPIGCITSKTYELQKGHLDTTYKKRRIMN